MKIRSPFVTAALVAAVALAGCGDDKSDETKPQGTSALSSADEAMQATPAEAWVNKVCVRLGEQATELQPPKIADTDPAATKKELVRFFDDVAKRLEAQLKEFKTIGPPPNAAQTKVWEAAQDDLNDTLKKVEAIRRTIRAKDFSSAADVNAGVKQLGKDFERLNAYLGPVDGLSKDPDLKAAFTSDPACAKVS